MAMLSRRAEYAEESAEVEVLLAQARKHEELDKKLAASQKRIQETGSNLSLLMGPVYTETQGFKATNQNVDRILESLRRLKQPMDGKEEEERILRDDPARVGIQRYLASIRRVEAFYSQLAGNPLRANQETANDLAKLLRDGAKKLQDLFKAILQQDFQPVEPQSYISKSKNSAQESGAIV
jgi:exocyst complex protein 7